MYELQKYMHFLGAEDPDRPRPAGNVFPCYPVRVGVFRLMQPSENVIEKIGRRMDDELSRAVIRVHATHSHRY